MAEPQIRDGLNKERGACILNAGGPFGKLEFQLSNPTYSSSCYQDDMQAIGVEDLSKNFTGRRTVREIIRNPCSRRKIKALSGISFSVNKGEITGLLGPNGAGKTTLIKILAGLVLPDSGHAYIGGFKSGSPEARAAAGLVTAEERSFFWRITARENLRFFAALHGFGKKESGKRIDSIAELLEIGEVLDRPVRELSGGNRGRLALARGMIHEPDILLLDEVARALDPGAARRLRLLLRRLADEKQIAILYAIHDLAELRRLCDKVLVLGDGLLHATGRFEEVAPVAANIFGLETEDFAEQSGLLSSAGGCLCGRGIDIGGEG